MKKNLKVFMTSAIMLGMALYPTAVFANDVNSYVTVTASDSEGIKDNARIKFKMERNFDELVENNIISQETADEMKTYEESKREELKIEAENLKELSESERKSYLSQKISSGKSSGRYDELITSGILTETEAEAIESYYKDKNEQQYKEQIQSATNRYVSENILTEEKATKVYDYLLEEYSNISLNVKHFETIDVKLPDGILDEDVKFEVAEKESGRDENKIVFKASSRNSFAYESLVTANIITSEEKEKMISSDEAFIKNQRTEQLNQTLNTLVEENKLTEDKAIKVKEYFANQDELIKPEKIVNEDKTIIKSADIFENMVTDGLLTEDEATLLRESHKGNHFIETSVTIVSDIGI